MIQTTLRNIPQSLKSGKYRTIYIYLRPCRADFPDVFFEVFPVGKGGVLDLRAIVIYRVDRVPQKRGDMGRLGDAELDQGEDAELGVEQSALLHDDASVLCQKGIQVLDKCRIEREERRIKSLIEILEFGFILIPRQSLAKLVEVSGTHGEEESEIFFLGGIGLHQVQICPAKVFLHRHYRLRIGIQLDILRFDLLCTPLALTI